MVNFNDRWPERVKQKDYLSLPIINTNNLEEGKVYKAYPKCKEGCPAICGALIDGKLRYKVIRIDWVGGQM
jgi:hypothetical protein